jgi:dolichyl-phosphate beta-glucosyltransferase
MIDLSIVIPAFNEAHKIGRDVAAAAEFLRTNGLSGEIIIADDGSGDGTAQAARASIGAAVGSALADRLLARGTPTLTPALSQREREKDAATISIRVLELPHRGKGSAVRNGILASTGRYVMFADSGLCVPFEDALPALKLLESGAADIVNGSRKLPQSVIARSQSWYRRLLSRLFRFAVRLYMGLPGGLSDTQCGFKVYRGDVARSIYGQCATDGFMFDLEVLLRAFSRGYRVTESPVHWTCDRDSRLRPSRILFRTLGELREVKRHVAEELATAEAIPRAAPAHHLAGAGADEAHK